MRGLFFCNFIILYSIIYKIINWGGIILKFIYTFICILFIPISIIHSSSINTIFYSNYRTDTITVGQRFLWFGSKNLEFFTDFESYLEQFNQSSFTPSKINYGIGFRYKHFSWEHHCLHDIDRKSGLYYPVKNKFSWSW